MFCNEAGSRYWLNRFIKRARSIIIVSRILGHFAFERNRVLIKMCLFALALILNILSLITILYYEINIT